MFIFKDTQANALCERKNEFLWTQIQMPMTDRSLSSSVSSPTPSLEGNTVLNINYQA